jgi:hypothetical protein
MSRTWLRSASIALACLVAWVSCNPNGVGPTGGQATLIVRADVSGTAVATVVVGVTAPDIPAALVFNIAVVNGVALGTITVPAGSNRTITMRAFDAGGVETHSGSITMNVQPGSDPTLSIVLQPLTGDVPINATLGSILVAVAPSTASRVIGDTVRLTASMTDWNGNPAVGTVSWATNNPGVALVDTSGLVKAFGAGTTTVSATFQGAAGHATITVTP